MLAGENGGGGKIAASSGCCCIAVCGKAVGAAGIVGKTVIPGT